MKKHHIIILVGMGEMSSTLGTRFNKAHPDIAVVSVTEQLRSPFEPDPIVIRNYRDCFKDPEYFESEPSKFISKPVRNYKK